MNDLERLRKMIAKGKRDKNKKGGSKPNHQPNFHPHSQPPISGIHTEYDWYAKWFDPLTLESRGTPETLDRKMKEWYQLDPNRNKLSHDLWRKILAGSLDLQFALKWLGSHTPKVLTDEQLDTKMRDYYHAHPRKKVRSIL